MPESSTVSPLAIAPPAGAGAGESRPAAFSAAAEAELHKLVEKYPEPGTRVLPTLHLAQREFGWISEDVMRLVADRLAIAISHVKSVVSFYTMLHSCPVGRHHVQVCFSLPCALRGAAAVYDAIRRKLGVDAGGVTPDGAFSLCKVECLALCDHAPVAQVNDQDHVDLSEKRAIALLEEIRHADGVAR